MEAKLFRGNKKRQYRSLILSFISPSRLFSLSAVFNGEGGRRESPQQDSSGGYFRMHVRAWPCPIQIDSLHVTSPPRQAEPPPRPPPSHKTFIRAQPCTARDGEKSLLFSLEILKELIYIFCIFFFNLLFKIKTVSDTAFIAQICLF